jgi:hypothetical protein
MVRQQPDDRAAGDEINISMLNDPVHRKGAPRFRSKVKRKSRMGRSWSDFGLIHEIK